MTVIVIESIVLGVSFMNIDTPNVVKVQVEPLFYRGEREWKMKLQK